MHRHTFFAGHGRHSSYFCRGHREEFCNGHPGIPGEDSATSYGCGARTAAGCVAPGDVAAAVINSVTLQANGRQVPLAFTLHYDTARIQENATYAVQARISSNGQLLFHIDVSYPVITRGNLKQVQIQLRMNK
ncbi:Type III secretion system lipoprotein chaperone (YscW) [Hymenobacter gelipurpurascens]|uniref:Type III secretion system lipoprotein chaperone (YscW) n=1 Tax=Hymenobacter gelipurpurascens TaxID=89968 RepID=A0A212SZQ0_9BACT|nr:Type III secretion system lipoprotein chaperone (YscW) [Hymenobacter gelipurpurascens]